MKKHKKRAAVIATGWVGDTIACTAAATSLAERGFETTLWTRWPQLKPILDNDKRFKTKTYLRVNVLNWFKFILEIYYDLVVWEPSKWSYEEPFTCEIRRKAGCSPTPEYSLFLSDEQTPLKELSAEKNAPRICISKDFHKRLYGRNAEDFLNQLSDFANIHWIGLDSSKNSKHGKFHSLVADAQILKSCDVYVGPEGGILWLAAGLGQKCVYFTEHILDAAKRYQIDDLSQILGSRNHFPKRTDIVALPPYCENDIAIKAIKDLLR
jgi:hypothetical protein